MFDSLGDWFVGLMGGFSSDDVEGAFESGYSEGFSDGSDFAFSHADEIENLRES